MLKFPEIALKLRDLAPLRSTLTANIELQLVKTSLERRFEDFNIILSR